MAHQVEINKIARKRLIISLGVYFIVTVFLSSVFYFATSDKIKDTAFSILAILILLCLPFVGIVSYLYTKTERLIVDETIIEEIIKLRTQAGILKPYDLKINIHNKPPNDTEANRLVNKYKADGINIIWSNRMLDTLKNVGFVK